MESKIIFNQLKLNHNKDIHECVHHSTLELNKTQKLKLIKSEDNRKKMIENANFPRKLKIQEDKKSLR